MKKVFLAVLAAALFGLSGCNNLEVSSEASVASERKTVLENLMKTGNYKVSEEEVLQALDEFLCQNEGARSAASNSYSLIESKKADVDFSGKARSAEISDVEFNVYSINGSGYALTSNDRRIGSLISVVPNGTYGEANEFTEMFDELLNDYVDDTVTLWNEISSGSDRSVENETIMTEGLYRFDDVKFRNCNVDSILKTNWTQKSFYNDAIEAVYGYDYCSGCSIIGTSQVIAHNKPPVKIEKRYLDKVVASWPKAAALDWDGTLHWDEIIAGTARGKIEMATLIYEVAEKVNANYGVSGTGAFGQYCNYALKDFYLRSDGFVGYSYKKVVDSIDNGSPLFMWGYNSKNGHLFNIDAYAELTVFATNERTSEKIVFTDNFIHCNLGWGGSHNGYYLSGVFDTRSDRHFISDSRAAENAPEKIEIVAEGTYSSGVCIVPNVRVDENLVPVASNRILTSYLNPGLGYAVYFAGDFEGSDCYQKAVRGTYEDGKWILNVTFPDSEKTSYNVYVGKYDLGETIQGGFEGLTWSEGEDQTCFGFGRNRALYADENPGFGYAVYYTGSFDGGRTWTKAIRGDYSNGFWSLSLSVPAYSGFYYKTLTGSYDLGEEVEYSYPGLIKQ